MLRLLGAVLLGAGTAPVVVLALESLEQTLGMADEEAEA